MSKDTDVHSIVLGCVQDVGSWIFMPEKVVFLTSIDKQKFEQVAEIQNDISKKNSEVQIKNFEASKVNVHARYIKVVAKNIGICPEGHPGAGYKSWIFADEIIIK